MNDQRFQHDRRNEDHVLGVRWEVRGIFVSVSPLGETILLLKDKNFVYFFCTNRGSNRTQHSI